MSKFHTGADYVEAITELQSDRLARSAFQNLVIQTASPGATVFDFGAGPGIDARFYAERGFKVEAYDVDPGMREYFSVHCREFIDTGQVALDGGTYRDFLARKTAAGAGRVELVTANFAPLNLIDDLPGLFARFHALMLPNGKILASVLSPYFVGDLKYLWWWRNSLRLWRDGHYSVPGAQASIFRRRLADFARQCAPYFALTCAYPGPSPYSRKPPHSVDMSRHGRHEWLRLTTSRFMFLLFERRAT